MLKLKEYEISANLQYKMQNNYTKSMFHERKFDRWFTLAREISEILSRDRLNVGRFWIDDWIYWTL
jgi:hypothetical protein